MGNLNCVCCDKQPSYARYHSNSKDLEPDLENVVGSILEMDPCLQDREEGVTKINLWIEEITPEIHVAPEHLEISRWKCIKYWEAQHANEVYGAEFTTVGAKLTGSCVRFYFEKRQEGDMPRLVIEHCGKPLSARESAVSGCCMKLKSCCSFSSCRTSQRFQRIRQFSLLNRHPSMRSDEHSLNSVGTETEQDSRNNTPSPNQR